MNIRHTFAILLAIVMLPVTLCGALYYIVIAAFVRGNELAEESLQAYYDWADERNKK